MGLSIARLRTVLVAGAAVVVLTIAGFLGYARYRTHRFLAGLPARLGVDIRRETDGYTLSKSVGPNTTMTLHAAKAVEHKDGKLTLHDVTMVLYGRKQDRADRISGAEFEYDQQAGIVRAAGEVHIDLQAPSPAQQKPSSTAPLPESDEKRVIHVRTSGLVFLQKLGVAATDQELEFRFGTVTGKAHGAEYNSDTGMVILQANVEAQGNQHGAPVTLHASHAELDRPQQQAVLTDAVYAAPAQTARGDRAVVHLRADSSPDRIEAEGHAALTSRGATVHSDRADVLLNTLGKAESAHLFGTVQSEQISPLRETRSQSADAQIAFDPQGQPDTALLTGSVSIAERARAAVATPWAERNASAGRMLFALDKGALRQLNASEDAHITFHEPAAQGDALSELKADSLQGRFADRGKAAHLIDLHGSGHTLLHRIAADGTEQTGTGDTLDVAMAPQSTGSPAKAAIQTATQSGHVTVTSKATSNVTSNVTSKATSNATSNATSTAAHRPGTIPPQISRGTAALAAYDGPAGTLTLSGAAEIADEDGHVSADRIVLTHASGDATAEGSVKVTYRQPSANPARPPEPVHVVAERAEFQHDAGRAIFYGKTVPARMWQAASQVEAPILELEQDPGKMTAHGDRPYALDPVHAVLVGASPQPDGGRTTVERVASQSMVYTGATRQVRFDGNVIVEGMDGTMRAAEATAFLQPSPPANTATNNAAPIGPAAASKTAMGTSFGGGMDRIVAKGKVELDQPGRRATGEQLVYTQADGLLVLTGTPLARPRIADETQGTVTGQTLRFHVNDRAIEVVGGTPAAPADRVRTVTRVKQP